MERSSNCSNDYTKRVTTIHGGKYEDPDGVCSVQTPFIFSCQRKDFDVPDSDTSDSLYSSAERILKEKGCDTSLARKMTFTSSVVGATTADVSAEKMSSTGRASSCFAPGLDTRDITHKVKGVCTNQYDYTDDMGRTVRDTTRRVEAELFVCGDITDDTGDDTQMFEDVRKVVHHTSSENGLRAGRPEDYACKFSVLPAF